MTEDTIAAIATPLGKGGIAIIKISGEQSFAIVAEIFNRAAHLQKVKTKEIIYGKIYQENKLLDEVLVLAMRGPKTYTCEDVIEIQCHGSYVAAHAILQLLLTKGMRLAAPGEFTKRAFLNGRIDLTEAEAVMDLINAMNDRAYQNSLQQLTGVLSDKIENMRRQLLHLLSLIEVAIDDPEEEYEDANAHSIYTVLTSVLDQIDQLLKSFQSGKIIKHGLKTAILGKPNVGKSSLLNALLQEDRVIVSDIPGTTRDIVSEYAQLDGILFHLMDTAGIRNSDDRIEQMGIEKSKELAQKADLLFLMVDGSTPLDEEDRFCLSLAKEKPSLVFINKRDLPHCVSVDSLCGYVDKSNILEISLKQNFDLKPIVERVKHLFLLGKNADKQEFLLSNLRHQEILKSVERSILSVLEQNKEHIPLDFLSIDLFTAYQQLGEITGQTAREEMITHLFENFCVGK